MFPILWTRTLPWHTHIGNCETCTKQGRWLQKNSQRQQMSLSRKKKTLRNGARTHPHTFSHFHSLTHSLSLFLSVSLSLSLSLSLSTGSTMVGQQRVMVLSYEVIFARRMLDALPLC